VLGGVSDVASFIPLNNFNKTKANIFPTQTMLPEDCPFLACRSRQASIVLERYFRFEISLLSILCMLIARMEMGTSRVSGDSDIIT